MKEISLLLVPEPGKAPQPLSTVTTVDPSPAVSKLWDAVYTHTSQRTVVLEGYTRDAWAWKPATSSSSSSSSTTNVWTTLTVQATDGRQKLPGFVKYLKDRQKCAYGRFLLPGSTGIWVVSYIQKSAGAAAATAATTTSSSGSTEDRMECRICTDLTQIPGCTLSATPPKKQQIQQGQQAGSGAAPIVRKRSGAGMLGKLVGAQQRTNQHVRAAAVVQQQQQQHGAVSAATTTATATADTTMTPALAVTALSTKTAGSVLNEFRNDMEQRMMEFDDNSAESEMRISISLAQHTAGLSVDDKARVTMEVLKFIVMEAAEDVNEEWIVYKEPSEFMDEGTMAVYKEGCAPPDVLEEVNKAELPEEVINQQKHAQQERQRQLAAENRKRNVALHAAFAAEDAEDEDHETLNTKKRDRRTMEDYERERKKGRP